MLWAFFDDDEFETLLAESNKFKPQELNEANVPGPSSIGAWKQKLNGVTAKRITPRFYRRGVRKRLRLIVFDAQRRFENLKNISYLLGQLKGVHNGDRLMPLEYGILTYQEKWTAHVEVLFKLYELGMANGDITPFTLQDDGKTLLTDICHLTPTLSPKDPAFPAWWGGA